MTFRSLSSSSYTIILMLSYLTSFKCNIVHSFTPISIVPSSLCSIRSNTSPSPSTPTTQTSLTAKKPSKKQKSKKVRAVRTTFGNRTKSSSGFGGGAIESCDCGSNVGYRNCCGRIHSDAKAFAEAGAEAVVRARYTAYAKREIDFIIGSTHPLNKDFMTDIDHWKKTIATNCYDNFELKNCKILNETYETNQDNNNNGDATTDTTTDTSTNNSSNSNVAKVTFVATMTQIDSREKTSFMETSTFERGGVHVRGGAWMYKSGVVEPVILEEEVEVEMEDCGDDEGGGGVDGRLG